MINQLFVNKISEDCEKYELVKSDFFISWYLNYNTEKKDDTQIFIIKKLEQVDFQHF